MDTFTKPDENNATIDLTRHIDKCLDAEKSRNLSERSLKELGMHLGKLNTYCIKQEIRTFDEMTPAFLKDFLLAYNPDGSASLGKALVWTLRKFFSFLTLNQLIPENSAQSLKHPKISPMAKLPQYLSAGELRTLMETTAKTRSLLDMTVLSLLATVGARSHEIAALELKDIHIEQQYIMLSVKGDWTKRTPISSSMAELLDDYVREYGITEGVLFRNNWDNPINKHWILRMVKAAGEEAGINRPVSPRMLRHTFATYAAERHGEVVTRALLGHCASTHSTKVYMHLIPSRFKPLVNSHYYQTTVERPGKNGSKESLSKGQLREMKYDTSGKKDKAFERMFVKNAPIDSYNAGLIKGYLTYLKKVRFISNSTIEVTRLICERWVRYLASRNVAKLTEAKSEHVLSWIEQRRSSGIVKDRTIEHELCIFRTLYNYLITFCGPSTDPVGCLPAFICRYSYERDYLSADELFRMLGTFDKTNPIDLRNYTIIALLWSSGLRSSELLSLEWRDIDLEEGVIHVKLGKGGKQRMLFLNDRILHDLRYYREQILAGKETAVFCSHPYNRKEISECGLGGRHLADIVRNSAKAAGIKRNVTPINLRHSFATHMYEAGVDIKDIQEMMGHGDKTETTVYLHVTVNAAKRLLNGHVYHTLHNRRSE
ncbi:tyrosine-type recombinase/integrase [Fibrobacterota bacterium]